MPEGYDKSDTQAFARIASAEDFSSIVTPELARLEALRSDFRNSCLILGDYADSIKLYSVVDNINRFPEIGDKNIQKFHRFVSYMMKSDEESDPSVAANLTSSAIAEVAQALRARTFGESDYLEPDTDDIIEILNEYRGYDECDSGRVARSASGVYAEFLSHNMSAYVAYVTEGRGIKGSRKHGDYLSNVQKNLSKLGMGLVDGYLFRRDFKKRDPGVDNA